MTSTRIAHCLGQCSKLNSAVEGGRDHDRCLGFIVSVEALGDDRTYWMELESGRDAFIDRLLMRHMT